MKANREDVVQAALTVERWCAEHFKKDGVCDCPFGYMDPFGYHACALYVSQYPVEWDLGDFLRTRGLKHG